MEDRSEKFLMQQIDKLEENWENKFEHHKVKLQRFHDTLFNTNDGVMFKVDRLERKASHSREVWYILVTVISLGISILSYLK